MFILDTNSLFVKIIIALFVGFIGGRVSKKFGLPNVTGYIIFGLFLGPSLPFIIRELSPGSTGMVEMLKPTHRYAGGLISSFDSSALSFISEIALAFIAFSIGVEFKITNLKKMGKTVFSVASFEVLFAVLAVFLITLFIPKPSSIMPDGYNPFTSENILMALLLSALSASTAPAATLLVMKQYRAYGPVTKTVLPVTAIDDIFGIIIFGLFTSITQFIKPSNIVGAPKWFLVIRPFIEIILSLGLGTVIGLGLRYLYRKVRKDKDETQVVALSAVLGTLAIVYIFNSLFADATYRLQLSPLLSIMMVGAFVANTLHKPGKLFESVNNFVTPFFVLFFTLAGASLNLNIIKSSALILIVTVFYIIARGGGKYVGTVVGASIVKAHKNIKRYAGFALLPQGGVSIGLVLILKKDFPGELSNIIQTIILLSILFFEISGPLFAKLAIFRSSEQNGLDKAHLLETAPSN